MKRTLQVFLGDGPRPIGTLHYDQSGNREHAAFAYDAAWLAEREAFPIEPGLPLVSGPQFHRKAAEGSVFHPIIADTEPDGWGRRVMLRDHAKRRQALRRSGAETAPAQFTAADFLLAVDDGSRVGALRFRDEKGVFQRASEPGRRTTPPLIELKQLAAATRAVENASETIADLDYLRGRATSLGGLRPKCSVLDSDGALAIGKFPSLQDTRAVTKGEVLAMVLAKKAGLNAAETRLVDSDGVPVALVRRFDRTTKGGRILYASAATLLGVEAASGEDHSYTEIVDALRMHGASVQEDVEELWRRIAFSILITNVDDHLRNHGFLHADRGLWRLAPAFDLNPFPDRARELKTWVSTETGPEATIEALLSVASYFRLSQTRAKKILREVLEAVVTWRKVGRKLGMTEAELDSYADAFEHAEIKRARAVAG
ncbi:type II toxin-antitoxin system HipA family toxin [Nibricoccus sp. IMCC34717]|uniref:type II toxin-antitoxin system HipA family toxin n=1 Tax=Nibricoccus sp. IMCC34717 TaxID=3034021 RepID=UPI00384EDD8A